MARTPQGLKEALAAAAGNPVWCAASAISEEEFRRRALPNLTRFDHALDDLPGDLVTIEEHHPGETVWVESRGTVTG